MRDKMPNVRGLESLMNQNAAAANRNLNLSQRVARVVSLDTLSGLDVMFINPLAVRWNPIRIENDLARVAQAARQRELFTANSDLVNPDPFSALPQRGLKSGNIDGDANITFAGLQLGLLNAAPRQLV